jgi:hypothetical protein
MPSRPAPPPSSASNASSIAASAFTTAPSKNSNAAKKWRGAMPCEPRNPKPSLPPSQPSNPNNPNPLPSPQLRSGTILKPPLPQTPNLPPNRLPPRLPARTPRQNPQKPGHQPRTATQSRRKPPEDQPIFRQSEPKSVIDSLRSPAPSQIQSPCGAFHPKRPREHPFFTAAPLAGN